MPRNPILEEFYATRAKLLAACKGDLHAYVEEARRRTPASGRPIATPSPRTVKTTSRPSAAQP